MFVFLFLLFYGVYQFYLMNERINQTENDLLQQQQENNNLQSALTEEELQRKIAQDVADSQRNAIEAQKQQEANLNSDKDRDGLTLRQENSLGTSDLDSDTDRDGVPDKYDDHPIGGDRNIVKHIEWVFDSRTWSGDVTIPSDVISYYEKIVRPNRIDDEIYYPSFINSEDLGVNRFAQTLKITMDNSTQLNWDYYDKVMFVATFVQSLHYTSDILVGYNDYTKYPMQTFSDGTGDCEDVSILAAALLNKLGFDVKLLLFPGHMAIGVLGENVNAPYFENNGKKYYYIEMTARGWQFGQIPLQFQNISAIIIDLA